MPDTHDEEPIEGGIEEGAEPAYKARPKPLHLSTAELKLAYKQAGLGDPRDAAGRQKAKTQ